jgi:deoxyribonuclease-4
MLASGFDVRTAEGLATAIDRCVDVVGIERVRCVHVNDSQTGLGSNRDRHAPLGTGELGREGCAAFFSEPRFEDLPAIFEGPGFDGRGAGIEDIRVARELRAAGLASRGGKAPRGGRGGRTRAPKRAPARRRSGG